MVRMPDATPSNIRDTKRQATGDPTAGPLDDATPELRRSKEGNWNTPKGPGGPAPAEKQPTNPTTAGVNEEPPPGHFTRDFPLPLQRVLKQSFRDRNNGRPQAAEALYNAYLGGQHEKTWWQQLDHLGDTDCNALIVIYEHIMRIKPEIWDYVQYINNQWYGGCMGFKVVYTDRDAFRQELSKAMVSGNNYPIAQDKTFGAAEHQEGGSLNPENLFKSKDTECWRELNCLDKEGIHICIAKDQGLPQPVPSKHDDIHVDWRDPAEGKNPDGTVKYDNSVSAQHWLQAMMDMGVPRNYLSSKLDIDKNDVAARVARIHELQKTIKPRKKDPDASGVPETPPDFAATADDVQKELAEIQPDWKTYRTKLAMRGMKGRARAQELVTQYEKLPLLEQEAKLWQ